MLQGAIIGIVVALVMMAINKSRAKAGTGLPGKIDALLREPGRGPMTLAQIAEAVGKNSFMGKGSVAQAIGGLSAAGKVKTNPAPAGTPQLKKVDVITYEAI